MSANRDKLGKLSFRLLATSIGEFRFGIIVQLLVSSMMSPALARSQDAAHAELGKALTFHASFDQGADAVFGAGDKRIHTAESYKKRDTAKPGLHQPDVRIATGNGRYGSALEFSKKNTTAIYFQAEKNVDYRESNWNGTVSFWLSLDPDQDLAPGYCDPIQVTDKEFNDAAAWVDFSRDEKPRHFRLGIFGNLAEWNPMKLPPDKNPDFSRRLVTVTAPPFGRGKWTHIVFTFSGLNAAQPGEAKLYLNGQLQGTAGPIREKFAWNVSQSTIRLGLNYTGLFDDLSIFQRALTAQEVQTLYGLDAGVSSLHP
jgi:hypothetical protein